MSFTEGTTWEKPELVVLTRTRPEEAVLDTCKTAKFETNGSPGAGGSNNGPNHTNDGCYQPAKCDICSSLASS